MSYSLQFFGQITVPGAPQGGTWWKTFSSATIGILIVLGVVAVISAGIFIWAAFFRKRRKRRHSYERWHKRKDQAEESSSKSSHHPGASHRRHRHHRHHRERPRNPTLAETGGLPPIRTPQNPPGSPPP